MESTALHEESLVLALFSVDGASAACAAHGNLATAAVLARYYARVATSIAPADGQVVKVMGDGVLAVFPPARARAAESACRQVQSESTALWHTFHPGCAARVKLGAGTVVRGRMGPPGEERADVYGQPLNALYKANGESFLVLPGFAALLE